MNIRQQQEQREHESLSPYASFSDKSLGRDCYEDHCDIRTIYQRDRDRILNCRSFRRLKHKTQVFLAPEGDHYRTRLTHTLEVAQIGRTIARALRLNEDLTEAIALGHDLGHTPFGHSGERALNEICKEGFAHSIQSIRVIEVLEKEGKGLNLSKEVKDGIRNHSIKRMPSTLEGKIIRLADKIAYVNSDIEDSVRGRIITEEEIPKELIDILGDKKSKRLNSLVHDIVSQSQGKPDIIMSPVVEEALMKLRGWLFQNVYRNPKAKKEETKAENLLKQLFLYYMENLEKLPVEFRQRIERKIESKERIVCDYIAGMTDRFAIAKYKELMIPDFWSVY